MNAQNKKPEYVVDKNNIYYELQTNGTYKKENTNETFDIETPYGGEESPPNYPNYILTSTNTNTNLNNRMRGRIAVCFADSPDFCDRNWLNTTFDEFPFYLKQDIQGDPYPIYYFRRTKDSPPTYTSILQRDKIIQIPQTDTYSITLKANTDPQKYTLTNTRRSREQYTATISSRKEFRPEVF